MIKEFREKNYEKIEDQKFISLQQKSQKLAQISNSTKSLWQPLMKNKK